MPTIHDYFGFNQQALRLRNERLELISENIANANTPNYKAKDIDFAKALQAAQSAARPALTQVGHQDIAEGFGSSGGDAIVYRVPLNPSVDNNTVEIGAEQARFGRATAEYTASLQFLENRIAGLRKAIIGE